MYAEWSTCRAGQFTIKGQVGNRSAQGTGGTKAEAREDMARTLLARMSDKGKRQLERDPIQEVRDKYEALVREQQRQAHSEARGEPGGGRSADSAAKELASTLGQAEQIQQLVSQANDFTTTRKLQRSAAEMTAILAGGARHLVLQRMWKGEDREKATLWVHSKDNQQQALVRVGTSVRLHTYDTWERALTRPNQWACPRVFKREFKCEPTFENMEKKLQIEWYRGARIPLCRVIWPAVTVGALG